VASRSITNSRARAGHGGATTLQGSWRTSRQANREDAFQHVRVATHGYGTEEVAGDELGPVRKAGRREAASLQRPRGQGRRPSRASRDAGGAAQSQALRVLRRRRPRAKQPSSICDRANASATHQVFAVIARLNVSARTGSSTSRSNPAATPRSDRTLAPWRTDSAQSGPQRGELARPEEWPTPAEILRSAKRACVPSS
jgi:hypothetical protein